MTDLKLFFPQWQGGVQQNNKLVQGAEAIVQNLGLAWADLVEVPLIIDGPNAQEHDINAYETVKQQLFDALRIIGHHQPDRIATIGGDCSVDIAAISYLNHKYDDDYLVVWFDAHGDLNTPQSSPSKNFHGMPIRTLFGEGDDAIAQGLPSHLAVDQVILIGARDLDPGEKKFLKENAVQVFSVQEAEKNTQDLIDAIKAKGKKYFHVHIDLDSLDPKIFPYVSYPVPNGLKPDTIVNIVKTLQRSLKMVGFALTEYSDDHQKGLPIIGDLIKLSFVE